MGIESDGNYVCANEVIENDDRQTLKTIYKIDNGNFRIREIALRDEFVVALCDDKQLRFGGAVHGLTIQDEMQGMFSD